MSEQIKQALLEKHPDYQYKPRKSSEKKRRVRRNVQNTAVPDVDAAASSPESFLVDENAAGQT